MSIYLQFTSCKDSRDYSGVLANALKGFLLFSLAPQILLGGPSRAVGSQPVNKAGTELPPELGSQSEIKSQYVMCAGVGV